MIRARAKRAVEHLLGHDVLARLALRITDQDAAIKACIQRIERIEYVDDERCGPDDHIAERVLRLSSGLNRLRGGYDSLHAQVVGLDGALSVVATRLDDFYRNYTERDDLLEPWEEETDRRLDALEATVKALRGDSAVYDAIAFEIDDEPEEPAASCCDSCRWRLTNHDPVLGASIVPREGLRWYAENADDNGFINPGATGCPGWEAVDPNSTQARACAPAGASRAKESASHPMLYHEHPQGWGEGQCLHCETWGTMERGECPVRLRAELTIERLLLAKISALRDAATDEQLLAAGGRLAELHGAPPNTRLTEDAPLVLMLRVCEALEATLA